MKSAMIQKRTAAVFASLMKPPYPMPAVMTAHSANEIDRDDHCAASEFDAELLRDEAAEGEEEISQGGAPFRRGSLRARRLSR